MNDEDTTAIRDNDTPPLVAQAFAHGAGWGKMRACDADRDRVAEVLNVAYSEGRLTRDEYDGRLEDAFSARTYADLDQIVADLPAARAGVVTPVAKTNGLAIASLACGLAQFVFGPLATIPAIVFGHVALHQIKRSGEQGASLALAGLVLGWAAVILGILLIVGAAMPPGCTAPCTEPPGTAVATLVSRECKPACPARAPARARTRRCPWESGRSRARPAGARRPGPDST